MSNNANSSRAQSRWLAAVPVTVGLLGALFLLPRSASPEFVPLPRVDTAAFARVVQSDIDAAERARREPLSDEVRELGGLLREWNRLEATSDDATRIASARAALERALPPILSKQPERLVALRAVQLEGFLAEVRAFEATGNVSEELIAVGGPFVARMRAVGWCKGKTLLLTEEERRVAYKMTWNGIVGVDRRAEFALTIDETRVLFGLYLRLPHAPESQARALDSARRTAKDVQACDALSAGERLGAESWRMERIGRLAAADTSYPLQYAKGISQFRLRKFLAAADSFDAYLRDHPEGPYASKAKSFMRASVAASQTESP